MENLLIVLNRPIKTNCLLTEITLMLPRRMTHFHYAVTKQNLAQ